MAAELETQLAFRVSKELVDALDLLADRMKKGARGAVRRRSDAARVALFRGLERELGDLQGPRNEDNAFTEGGGATESSNIRTR
jgi:hypothetical protein